VSLIRETKKTRSVGVPPGTGLGNTGVASRPVSEALGSFLISEWIHWRKRAGLVRGNIGNFWVAKSGEHDYKKNHLHVRELMLKFNLAIFCSIWNKSQYGFTVEM